MTEPNAHLFSVFQTNKKKIWAVRQGWTVDRIQRVGRCRNEKVCRIKKKYMERKLESRGRVERRTTMLERKIPHSEGGRLLGRDVGRICKGKLRDEGLGYITIRMYPLEECVIFG